MKIFRLLMLKNVRAFRRDRLWYTSTLLFPWLASIVLQIAMEDRTPKRYWFFCIIFCYWFFINLGVRLVIGEKKTIQQEFYAGLSRAKYLLSKFCFYGVLCFYMASVFAVSVNVEWLNWRSLNILYRAQFIEGINEDISYECVAIDSPEFEALDARETFQHDVRAVKAEGLGSLLFSYKRLRNDNGWGLILIKQETGWSWLRTGSDADLNTEWVELKKNYSLFDRLFQQVVQLFLFDYSLWIFFLAGLAGLALGLCISVRSRTMEFAVQLVPYITLCQIVLSKLIVDAHEKSFEALTGGGWRDIGGWDFGSIASLLTASRFLNVLAESLIRTAKNTTILWRDLIQYYGLDLLVVWAWILIPLIIAYLSLKRWRYDI
ncbi:MAG: hypothetical protein AAF492_11225 [Verrucomicrobiota bacterium]